MPFGHTGQCFFIFLVDGAILQISIFIFLPYARNEFPGIRREHVDRIRNPSGIVNVISGIGESIRIIFAVSIWVVFCKRLDDSFKLVQIGRCLKPQIVQPVLTDDHDFFCIHARCAGNSIRFSILRNRIEGFRIFIIDLFQTIRHIFFDIVINCFDLSGFDHIGNHLCSINRKYIGKFFRTCQCQTQLGVIVAGISAEKRCFHL